MAIVPDYTHFGGVHAETASLTNILRAHSFGSNSESLSEAMILGIGGGLGAGYILYDFKEYNTIWLYFGWRTRWTYPITFYENLCQRLQVTPTFRETGTPKVAQQQLEAALEDGEPVVAWVDRAHLPYLQLPGLVEGHIPHFVTIYGVENGEVLVDDLAAKPFRIPVEMMASARARIPSFKNRLMLVTADGEPDLPAAIMAGIHDEIDHLSQKSESFSLPVFQKWGKMMTNAKNAKAWPVVFADRHRLYGALKSVYEGVEQISTGGGGMRGLYADFLDEAAGIVNPGLSDVANIYRDLAAQWSAFADSALPDSIEPLRETKSLLRQRYDILMAQGSDGLNDIQPLTEQLGALYAEYNRNFPMSDAEVADLFRALGDQLSDLYQAEVDALTALKKAVN